tara:strand:+ start:725 stop:949 length:225 start_codon:yes stop_codon:yes gene_type:complete
MNINVGNLVRVNLGFFSVEGDPLRCERKYAWGLVKEIRREGERFMVHFIEDGREYLIKRFDIKTVVTDDGQILS